MNNLRIGTHLDKPRVAVQVQKLSNKQYVLMPEKGIAVVKPGTHIVLLDPDISILSPDKEKISATGKFYITADTIGPYHLLLDIF